MYLFYAWCWEDGKTIAQTWPAMVGIFFGCIALAYIVLKLYDEPVRKWLSRQ
jgi:peptidoglycan/LPS O-acetylase OafA/YrhL